MITDSEVAELVAKHRVGALNRNDNAVKALNEGSRLLASRLGAPEDKARKFGFFIQEATRLEWKAKKPEDEEELREAAGEVAAHSEWVKEMAEIGSITLDEKDKSDFLDLENIIKKTKSRQALTAAEKARFGVLTAKVLNFPVNVHAVNTVGPQKLDEFFSHMEVLADRVLKATSTHWPPGKK